MIEVFDLKFENKLIKEYAEGMYVDMLLHAKQRQLQEDYVVDKFIKELQAIARNDGFIK